ncbi:MAG: UDP-N-acetylglucosamine 1-carboxyvinyltransferase [Oscillospiraceae bacterium]|nr:UDP-N-acetylglucosamine 1-carboxyvinyltransferase [Oscillospiraceae bacterium]
METLTIRGGRPLRGTLAVQGSKNAVLPILAAAAAVPGRFSLSNCPPIRDVAVTRGILEGLGLSTSEAGGLLHIDSSGPVATAPDPRLAGRLRSSVLLLGALLARNGAAEVPLPGGCVLGTRPLDLHLRSLEALGVQVRCEDGRLLCRGRPRGGTVLLRYPSVGATENLILAALGAAGPVCILGAAREPEIRDLAVFLNACGACVQGAGSGCVRIRPASLHGAVHRILPDRMEAATFLCAAAAAGGSVTLTGLRPGHLRPVLDILRRAGCRIDETGSRLRLRAGALRSPGTIRTGPYPAFPTDAQAPVMAALLRAAGTSVIEETVFEARYRHVPALLAFGGQVELEGRLARIHGVPRLHGARAAATDLRGGAAMVIAALAAEGESRITQAWHLDRGYGRFAERLRSLGADVESDC